MVALLFQNPKVKYIICLVLFSSGAVLAEYSQTRNKDVEAMCDLAMYNYIEVTIISSIIALLCDIFVLF